MSNQVVLHQVLENPFAMGENVEQMCFNATQWLAQQQQFRETAMQFGYFCLIVGCIIGALAGYYYAKRKYAE
jgi:ABC-type xylose transport system permease subunit